MNRFLATSIFASLLTLTSCSWVFSGLYGLKKPDERSTAQIQHFAEKYKIQADASFTLDTSYLTFLKKKENTEKDFFKNHSQPLQALYFNKDGQLISWHMNCYAGGFPNLKWNRNGAFDTFPPVSQTEVDAHFTFQQQMSFIKSIEGTAFDPAVLSKTEFNVVVYWSIFMGRQSKRLIKLVKENCALAGDEKANLLFINNDGIYSEESP